MFKFLSKRFERPSIPTAVYVGSGSSPTFASSFVEIPANQSQVVSSNADSKTQEVYAANVEPLCKEVAKGEIPSPLDLKGKCMFCNTGVSIQNQATEHKACLRRLNLSADLKPYTQSKLA